MIENLIDILYFENTTKKILPKVYYAGGAGSEQTITGNTEAFSQIKLLPRVLMGNEQRDLKTHFLGIKTSAPLMIAPSAYHALAHPDGELATCEAALETDIPMIVSMLANKSLA